MVQVQSSWFPLVDRNPQVFMEIPKATPADFKAATQRVYRSGERSSSVTLMVGASGSGPLGERSLPPPQAARQRQ